MGPGKRGKKLKEPKQPRQTPQTANSLKCQQVRWRLKWFWASACECLMTSIRLAGNFICTMLFVLCLRLIQNHLIWKSDVIETRGNVEGKFLCAGAVPLIPQIRSWCLNMCCNQHALNHHMNYRRVKFSVHLMKIQVQKWKARNAIWVHHTVETQKTCPDEHTHTRTQTLLHLCGPLRTMSPHLIIQ